MVVTTEIQDESGTRLSDRDVAAILANVADMLQILDANRFRVIAFQNAAESVRTLGQDVNALHVEGKLQTIPGVGKGIADAMAVLLETGVVPEFEELKAQVPSGVVEMIHVPDVGPKTAQRLWHELDVTSVEEMRLAAEAGKIRVLKGFGAKKEEKILSGIALMAKRGEDRTPLGEARPIALALMAGLGAAASDAILRMEAAGSLRRWKETIGDVDILVVSSQPAEVMAAFRALPQVSHVAGSGETKSSVILSTGLQVDLRVVEAQHWGAALQYFTGSKEHNVALRELALRQGWSLNEYGLTATGQGEAPAGEQRYFGEEEELYRFLGLEWTPPEFRENHGEIVAARQQSLPRLIELRDIRGELHGHTVWSDGAGSVEEMAEIARRRGYEYWSVSDHSVGLGMVNGLDAARLRQQAEEITAFNRRCAEAGINFHLLASSEVEIMADGSLALPDEILAGLDVVVASIHSGLRQDRETITERCLRAVRNPHVDILGHPTGRMIPSRPPSDLDVERVLQVCAETGTVVEVNAHPSRLDLNDVYARRAVEVGCKIVINSDAHQLTGMEMMEYGIGVARRAWLRTEDVVNTLPLDEMLAQLKDRRSG